MDRLERQELGSLDIAQDRREKLVEALKSICPEALRENRVDLETLKRSLGDFVDAPKERFGLNWHGKAECLKVIQHKSIATLKPNREQSVAFDDTQNMIIEGDNLEVLKLLQKSYYGKVKMIYIDPPYNTGKEFIYPDNYTQSLETYLSYTGQIDEEGRKFSTNSDRNGRYHAKWLNMMYPRLFLARNLLRDDGVIFISIDDNEQANLKLLCDEIFGEENFVAGLIWERAYSPKNDAKFISKNHDYVLMYARDLASFTIGRLDRTEEANTRYSNPDNDPRGVWKPSDLSVKTYNASNDYPITAPSGRVIEPPASRCWSLSKKAFFERLQDNRIWFGSDGNSVPSIKRFLSELKFDGMAPTSILFYKDVGHSQEGAKEVVSLLDGNGSFDGPKPTRLINRLITLANTDQDDIILDFFAGSGTTAHAVMALNKDDGGNRKFILVQLPEKTDEDSEAFRAGYRTIADLTRERVRRAGKKLLSNEELAFSNLDVGFKAFSLDRSNFRIWDEETDDVEAQIELNLNPLVEGAHEEAVLYELLIKEGLPLDAKLEKRVLEGKGFTIVDETVFICLEKELTLTFLQALADLAPHKVLCLDEGFHQNDSLLTNAILMFKAKAQDIGREIVFKTI